MTKQVKIYHNPRCSKSRETLNLLKENGVEPEVVLYLETPADAATLRDLLKMLGMNSARELMRQKEDRSRTRIISKPVNSPYSLTLRWCWPVSKRHHWVRCVKSGSIVQMLLLDYRCCNLALR